MQNICADFVDIYKKYFCAFLFLTIRHKCAIIMIGTVFIDISSDMWYYYFILFIAKMYGEEILRKGSEHHYAL